MTYKIKKKIPVTIVIPTLGYNHLKLCLNKININTHIPYEVIIIIPKKNFNQVKGYTQNYKNLKIRVILSKKKNQVHQRIIGFKMSKTQFVMQLDDDVNLHKNCLIKLYNFLKRKDNSAVAPRYINNNEISKIYKKPNKPLLLFYHWLINSSKGFDPGKISLSGFNYSEEDKLIGYKQHDWLSGGAVMHYKKNLVLRNYYPYQFKRSFCEDILHSIILTKKKITLYKYFEAKASAKISGNITQSLSKFQILNDFYSEFLIRRYIVKKFNLSETRLIIYYLIYFLRIILKILK